ncbi:hypothetical protein [Microbispora corallina]|nr:hypothetical protein [Microbispora corallina]
MVQAPVAVRYLLGFPEARGIGARGREPGENAPETLPSAHPGAAGDAAR